MYFLGRRETILPKRVSIPSQRRGFYPRGLPTTGLSSPVYLRQVFLPNGFILSNARSSLFPASIFSFFRSFATLIDRLTRSSQKVAGYQALRFHFASCFGRAKIYSSKLSNDGGNKLHLDRSIARVITRVAVGDSDVDRSRRVSRSEEPVRWPA